MGITLNPGTLLNGNGIDVNSLVQQALAPQNAEVTVLQQQQSTLQTQAGLLTSINSDLGNLLSAAQSLSDPLGSLTAISAQSSQPSIVTASAQPGATAGTHNILVTSLATQGTLYTEAVKNADTSILPTGVTSADLSIQIGGATGSSLDVPISSGTNDTLNSLVSYINGQKAGVTATVLTDSTGSRLAIFSNSTGTTGALTVNSNTSALTFNPPVGGTNAVFTVDNIPFSSTSNTVTGAIPNVTLNLLAAVQGVPVQIAVGADNTKAAQAITNFVNAYNTVVGDINAQFTVNPSTNTEGPLGGDSALRSLQASLLTDVGYTPGNGTLFANVVSDATVSILPPGAQSADIKLQIGSSGPTFDVPITAGVNDTLNSLASYINNQNFGLKATVTNGVAGARLSISNTSSTVGAVNVTNNTSSLTFNPPVVSNVDNLSALGITMNDDGTLSLNSSQLTNALSNNSSAVLNFFQNTALNGFANNFANDLTNLTSPTSGVLSLDFSQNQAQQNTLSSSITGLQTQISAHQQTLQSQFAQVNAEIEAFPFELQAIQRELGLTPTTASSIVTGSGA